MKTKSFIMLVLAYSICICASAQVKKEKKDVSFFNKITVSSGINVFFTQEGKCSLEIEAEAENMRKIEAKVEGGCLVLKVKDGERFRNNRRVTAYVSAPELNAIAISSGGDFTAKRFKNDKKLDVAASGGADFEVGILDVNDCNLAFSGGADCDVKQFKAKTVKLAISGGSDADLHLDIVDKLTVAASGGADVELTGKARDVTVTASGGSDIDVRNLSADNITSNKSGGGRVKVRR